MNVNISKYNLYDAAYLETLAMPKAVQLIKKMCTNGIYKLGFNSIAFMNKMKTPYNTTLSYFMKRNSRVEAQNNCITKLSKYL